MKRGDVSNSFYIWKLLGMRNEATPESAWTVIRPYRPSVHPSSRGGGQHKRGGGAAGGSRGGGGGHGRERTGRGRTGREGANTGKGGDRRGRIGRGGAQRVHYAPGSHISSISSSFYFMRAPWSRTDSGHGQ
jgi:hypothetical protein